MKGPCVGRHRLQSPQQRPLHDPSPHSLIRKKKQPFTFPLTANSHFLLYNFALRGGIGQGSCRVIGVVGKGVMYDP
ncbi:hypothetical protein E2C01_079956 [Portunus trituberculatus]|uniref:Uncharacterized protein n=1 Tax=Portunus trituberculatus TaxID=210409 RepID=A0A5B7IS50_PORTR|nr:hypothetical protein [Portunus trituberculatus]